MNKEKIIEFLEDNGMTEIEEIPYKENTMVVRFFYDFDEDELKAAKAYANDESDKEEESDEWFEEFFLPYLNDLAIDNAGEILEEAMEDLELDAQYISYEADADNYDYCEFIAVFYKEGSTVEIEKVMDELNI